MTSETASEHWYALKVFYNKVFEIEAYLKDKAFESYIPLKTVEMMWRGEKKNLPQTGRFFPDVRSRDGTCRDRIAAAVE